MSAPALPPTAPTTLVILLGASAWPKSPGFQASQAFAHAAQGFRNYLLDPQGFGLSAANLLDQFDTTSGASDQLEMLASFLEQRAQTLKAMNQGVRDVLVYFVGHGGFVGSSADFYLLTHRADASSLRATGMAIDALAEVLREKARQTRRYLFLDCCFAAAAFRSFQGGPDQTAITKILDAFYVQARSSGFPRKGTVLLCSSDQKSPSLLLPDESCTMFSHALLDVLRNGDLHRPLQLSLRDIKELAEDRLAALPEKNAPRPGLHSPDQSEGDVADVPFFPNHRVQEERRRQAEEERVRKAENERLLREEREQLRMITIPVAKRSPLTKLGSTAPPVSGVIAPPPQQGGIPVARPARRGISRRTVILGLGLSGSAVVGGGLTWWILAPHPHPLYTYRGHSAGVRTVAWSPNGQRIASGGDDATVQVWDAVDGAHAFTYHRHGTTVWAVAWSPNGQRIASGSGDSTVQVWDAANGDHAFTYRGHANNWVYAVAWSPNGQRIASAAGTDGTVQVWDAIDGSHVFIYRGHADFYPGHFTSGFVDALAWSSDSQRVASGSGDSTVQIWQDS